MVSPCGLDIFQTGLCKFVDKLNFDVCGNEDGFVLQPIAGTDFDQLHLGGKSLDGGSDGCSGGGTNRSRNSTEEPLTLTQGIDLESKEFDERSTKI